MRLLPILLVVALGFPAVVSEDSGGVETGDMQPRLDQVRSLIEDVEASGEDPSPFALVLLRTAAEAIQFELKKARETPEESTMTEEQLRQARRLLNRISALLLLPSVRRLGEVLDSLEASAATITSGTLVPLVPAVQKLRQETVEIAEHLDPEIPSKPDGLARAQDVLKRFFTWLFDLQAQELTAKVQYWDTLSPPTTEEELAPVLQAARDLEAGLDRELAAGTSLTEKTATSVRLAVARARTLDLIPFTESLMPLVVEMESRATALSEAEIALVEKKAWQLYDRIEAVRPGMLDAYDAEAPPAAARARAALRRLVALEIQPSVGKGQQLVSELEQREQLPTEEELEALREPAQELRELILGFEARPVAQSPEAEPDLIQQARELLWRFALVDLRTSVAEMEPFVSTLENKKGKPSTEELAELDRLAERMQPKLRAARGKDEGQQPEGEVQEGVPKVIVQARDLMRRSAALQPEILGAPEEGRDAPVTTPFLSWFRFYGSLRLRTFLAADGFSRVDDETSRIGFRAQKKIDEKFEIYGRLEVGVNPIELFDELPDLGKNENRLGQLFPLRLALIGAETPWGSATLGKVWSAYWDVAVFSDQLPAYTGLTTGTFNNGDGSISGTGRTDQTIQYRGKTGKYSYTGQMQLRNLTENSHRFADTLGGSTIYQRKDGIDLGGAFSIVRDGVDDPTPDQPKSGDRAFLVGARTKMEKRYFGATLNYTLNHYRDDLGRFFDGLGFEVYSDYLVHKKVRLRFVADGLFPVGGHPGDYRLLFLVAGASYDILTKLRVFLLPRLNLSKDSDGSRRTDHSVAIILLFNF